MQSTTILCFALVCLATVCSMGYALPQDGVLTEETEEYLRSVLDPVAEAVHAVEPAQEHHRQRRATCDLLSGFGVNDSACAAHCILRGNRGGYCNGKKVCVCRN
ncbi:defensin-A-like [Toxorhynchites rutilus septentrionalis]|uniref:defensin-A-like n=1 Tax=Toxorhynchites rutilus septentrionalis TaxID=329112 RepID=UPI0024786011|nr:defensin-A-like [Toxorhynchites rutilus septentrionalis]